MFDPIQYFEKTNKQIERGISYSPFKKSLSFFVSRNKSNTPLNINFTHNISYTNLGSIAAFYYPFGNNIDEAINTVKIINRTKDITSDINILLLISNKLDHSELNIIGSIPQKLKLFFYLNYKKFKPIGIVKQIRFYKKPKTLPQIQVEFFLYPPQSYYESSTWLNRFNELTDD